MFEALFNLILQMVLAWIVALEFYSGDLVLALLVLVLQVYVLLPYVKEVSWHRIDRVVSSVTFILLAYMYMVSVMLLPLLLEVFGK